MLAAIFFNGLRNGDKRENRMAFLGVQEAVSSNLAVPTFKIKNLRALTRCPFLLCSTLSSTFASEFFFELAASHWS